MMPCREANSRTLIGGNHMTLGRQNCIDIGAEFLEQRIRHACKKIDAFGGQRFVEGFRRDHHFVPGMSSRISLIGIIRLSHSAERECSRIESAVPSIAG